MRPQGIAPAPRSVGPEEGWSAPRQSRLLGSREPRLTPADAHPPRDTQEDHPAAHRPRADAPEARHTWADGHASAAPRRRIARRSRRRLLALALALCLLVASAVTTGFPGHGPVARALAASTHATSTSAAAAAGATRAGTCTVPAPTTAEEYTRAFASLGASWVGADQTASTVLPDGRVLWLFGDTVQGSLEAGRLTGGHLVHSSFVMQDRGCFRVAAGHYAGAVLPAAGDGSWYWPQQAVVAGSTLWVTVLRVSGGSTGTLDFHLLGVDLAEFRLLPGGAPRYVAMHATPASQAGDFGVLWGTAVVRDGSTLYVYGTRRVAQPLSGKELLLARVPVARVVDASAWSYRTDSGWSSTPTDAVVLRSSQPGVSTSFSVHRSGATWTLVTKRGEFLGDTVVALEGAAAWGPFAERSLFSAPSGGTRLTYVAMAHPEARLADGGLLVSVNTNDLDPSTVLSDPSATRPVFTSAR